MSDENNIPVKEEIAEIQADEGSTSSTSTAISSPGGNIKIEDPCAPVQCTPARKSVQGVHSSPFGEWAKSNLSNFDNEIFSPSKVDKALLSPPYSHAVKIESPAVPATCKDEFGSNDRIDSNLQRHSDAPFSPPFSRNFTEERGIEDEKALSTSKDSSEPFDRIVIPTTVPPPIVASLPQPQRRATLSVRDLFSFDLMHGKVTAVGFEPAIVSSTSSFQRSGARRPPVPSLPPTPGLGLAGGRDAGESKRVCSCKKSRCLKLYCECFAASVECDGCKCSDCANDGRHDAEKEAAVERIKQRSHNAFAPKIEIEETPLFPSSSSLLPHGGEKASSTAAAAAAAGKTVVGMHARGCRCKRSHCLKKYCECFQGGVRCGDNCKCEECKNVPEGGSTPDGPRAREPGRRSAAAAAESPSPRSKKPRMLDFNLTSSSSPAGTPLQPSRHAAPPPLEQESPERRMEGYPTYLMFGSPSGLFLAA